MSRHLPDASNSEGAPPTLRCQRKPGGRPRSCTEHRHHDAVLSAGETSRSWGWGVKGILCVEEHTNICPSSSSGDTPAPSQGPLVIRRDLDSGCGPCTAWDPREEPTAAPASLRCEFPAPPGKISESAKAVTRPSHRAHPDKTFRGTRSPVL